MLQTATPHQGRMSAHQSCLHSIHATLSAPRGDTALKRFLASMPMAALAACAEVFPCCMCRGSESPRDLWVRVESGDKSVLGSSWDSALLCAAGWEPFGLVERAVAAAGELSGGARPRAAKQLPASLDSFGWCTWDAFYSTVSARGAFPPLRVGWLCPAPRLTNAAGQDNCLWSIISSRMDYDEMRTETQWGCCAVQTSQQWSNDSEWARR